ncbi:ABC transporter substrate-binding protein [Aquimarina pacifica]|uniref:ABC transporter substrate-binding protein n=1 Tax=Aquimarina pacifica TaxID=1296415 RepID=UPI00046ED53D|nr:ABC transporter substrate-binding protein [Aquimarina pacifica]
MKNHLLILLLFISFFSCKYEKKTQTGSTETSPIISQKIEYASGFSIENHETYKKIQIISPWPDAKNTFTYILYSKGTPRPSSTPDAKFIAVPVDNLVVSSTTDIPILEYLDIENMLVGFPHTDYISSKRTRALIDSGKIKELGNNGHLNTERTLEIAPELIIGYSATGDTKTYDLLERTGIPVVMNGSWMEQHPLGRAEWIKFIAAFVGKEVEASNIFENIKKDYTQAQSLAQKTTISPTVLSGNMFKDIWHVPGGDSYIAKFFKDANTTYIWEDTKKTGSIALSFESVFEKAQQAELWIGSGVASSLSELQEKNNRYSLFDAFKNKSVYSSALKTGPTGGLLYYELGPMRPDLILKDIIRIAHPELLTAYEPYFFEKLN